MATGKTTVGKALVKRIGRGYKLVETDQIVINIAGKSIPQIFAENGEDMFRKFEIEACKIASKAKNVIISCGGGIVINEENLHILKKTSLIVLLKATIKEILERAINEGREKRPIIDKCNSQAEIERIYELRKPLYASHADLIIDTTNKRVDEIVDIVMKEFNL